MNTTSLPTPSATPAIHAALATICQPGEVHELRVPNAGKQRTISGYFTDRDLMAQAASQLSGVHPGIYITANPVNSALKARAVNRVISYAQNTTSDLDVTRRRWLPVDLDPQRPAGISATSEEHEAAHDRAREIYQQLKLRGWPASLTVDTGNGFCLLYPIDLPNDVPSRDLVQRCLRALSFEFDDDQVHVDQAMYNAARIIRIPGTLNGKGDNTTDRPHRQAKVVHATDAGPVATELLEQLAAAVVEEQPTPMGRGPSTPFSVEGFIASRGLEVRRTGAYQNGVRWLLGACPLHGEAVQGSSCAVIQWPGGTIIFKCQHSRCAGRTWHDLREHLEPGYSEHHARQIPVGTPRGEPMRPAKAENTAAAGRPVGILMSDVKAEPIKWFWPLRIARRKVTLVDGDPGLGKSVLTIDITARVTTGRPWPDGSRCPLAGVVILSAEDGLADTIRPRLDAAGADVKRVVALQVAGLDDHEVMIPADLTSVERAIERVGAGLVIVDPLMAYLGGDTNSHRDQDVRRALRPLADLAERTGVAIIVIRHLNKTSGAPVMYRGGGSIGIIGAARIALVVGMDPEDEDRRVLAAVKTNIGPKPPALAYRLVEAANGTVKVVWEEGECSLTAAQLLAVPADSEERSLLDEAVDFLRELLSAGPVEAKVVEQKRKAEGISEATLRRARIRLGVKTNDREGFGQGFPSRWSLPPLLAHKTPYPLNPKEWTSSGVYNREKFHAKAYITHAKMEVIGAQALVGSSNFTRPGLTQNVELAVVTELTAALTARLLLLPGPNRLTLLAR